MSWIKELEKNYQRAEDLRSVMPMPEEKQKKMNALLDKYPMSITDYYLSLIDWEDPEDPIRRMCIPSVLETDTSGTFDTSGEKDNTVIAGMQHKYQQTVLILSTNRCAMYCRHCFRKRLVGLSDNEVAKHFSDMFDYVRDHEEVSNVLISGGDSLLNTNEKIRELLEGFSDIDHVDLIRFGSRVPVVFPARITNDPELLSILSDYSSKKQIYVVTQFNHPKEITEEAIKSVRCLQKLGIVVKNQTVLLKGVNDSSETLAILLKKLTASGIVPYYIFQCRPVTGVKNQFQVPLLQGYDIIEGAKALQNGQGKCFTYCFSHPRGKIQVVGKLDNDQMLFKFHEAKDEKDQGRVFIQRVGENQCWLDDIPE